MKHNHAMPHTVASVLRDLKASGLTQIEISRQTKIPQPRLSKWDAGRYPASADDALKLLELRDKVMAEGATHG